MCEEDDWFPWYWAEFEEEESDEEDCGNSVCD